MEGGGEKDGVGGLGCGDGEDGVREVEMGRERAEMRGDEKDGVEGGGDGDERRVRKTG